MIIYQSTVRAAHKIKSLGINLARWYILIPFYGTEAYEWIKKNGKFLDPGDLESGTWSATPQVFFETESFTKQEMLKAYYFANAELNNFLFLCKKMKSLISS